MVKAGDDVLVDAPDVNRAELELGVDIDGDGDIGEGTTAVVNPLATVTAESDSDSMKNARFHRDLRELTFKGWGHATKTIVRFCCSLFPCFFLGLFPIPLSTGCVERVEGEWPSEHWLFYCEAWVSVCLMFLWLPLFTFVLTGDYFNSKGGREPALIRKRVGQSLLLTMFPATFAVALAVWQAKTYGFPMYFTQVSAGFPALFLALILCAAMMGSSLTKDMPLKQSGSKIFKLLIIFIMLVVSVIGFPFLGKEIAATDDALVKAALSFCFPALKFLNARTVRALFSDTVEMIVPFHLFISFNNALFPAAILPSVLSFEILALYAVLDILVSLFTLRDLWWPILQTSRADSKLEEQRQCDMKVIAEMKRELEETEQARAEVREVKRTRRQRMLDRMHAMRDRANFAAADVNAELDRLEREEAEINEKERKLGKDLDGDGDIGQTGKTDEERQLALEEELKRLALKAEKKEDKRAMRTIKKKLRATVAAKVQADESAQKLLQERIRLWKEELLHTEQMIVIFTVQEFVEVIVPLFVAVVECYLRFGWNRHVIPQISNQPLQSTDMDDDGIYETGFITSIVTKLALSLVNAVNFMFAGHVVNNCSDIDFHASFVYILGRYHEVLVGEPFRAICLSDTHVYMRCLLCKYIACDHLLQFHHANHQVQHHNFHSTLGCPSLSRSEQRRRALLLGHGSTNSKNHSSTPPNQWWRT